MFLLGISLVAHAQTLPKLYHPEANAQADLALAIQQAKVENKHVFIQIGGNWCIWCLKFHGLIHENKSLDSFVEC